MEIVEVDGVSMMEVIREVRKVMMMDMKKMMMHESELMIKK